MSFKLSSLAITTAIAAVAFFMLVQLAAALPATALDNVPYHNDSTPFTVWGRFCDDDACSVNCGEYVDLQNPGCLNEANRRSIHVKSNGPDPLVGLVYSPSQDCPCQTECENFGGINPDCWHLDATRAAASQSYRFIGWGQGGGAGGQCDGAVDNCPARYDALDEFETVAAIDVEARSEEEETVAADSGIDVEQNTDIQDHVEPQEATDMPEDQIVDSYLTPSSTNYTDLTALPDLSEFSDAGAEYTGGWARFCNDANCTEGCGQWVSITNQGCLTENYRGSIAMKNTGANIRIGLVYSPTAECNCQTRCDEDIPPEFDSACFTLDPEQARESHSYRMINWGWHNPCSGSVNNC